MPKLIFWNTLQKNKQINVAPKYKLIRSDYIGKGDFCWILVSATRCI